MTKIPAKVRTLAGKEVLFSSYPRRDASTRFIHLADDFNAICSSAFVLFHHTADTFEEVLAEQSGGFTDLAWDGQNIWLATIGGKGSVSIIDQKGKTLARAGLLPPANHFLQLHALGAGQVLAVGGQQSTDFKWAGGWIAILTRKPHRPPEIVVEVLLKDTQLPPEWSKPPNGAPITDFTPASITEPLAASRTVIIPCRVDYTRTGSAMVCSGCGKEVRVRRHIAPQPEPRKKMWYLYPENSEPFWIGPTE